MIQNMTHFLAGLAVLVVGAELLVRGAASLAKSFGISEIVVGLTVVAFGTSAPEMVVTVLAALSPSGGGDIAIGNVVGSNIFNTGVILALAAIVRPLPVQLRLPKIDCPIAFFATLALGAMAWDGTVGLADALLLLAGFAFTLWLTVRDARTEPAAVNAEYKEAIQDSRNRGRDILFVILGLAALLGGGHLIVNAAVAMARALGISELVIGLTIVAAGTSLPELATTVVASVRNQPDIAVGNVIGSNIFNILLILGTSAAITPITVPSSVLHFDLPVLLAFSAALWPIIRSGHLVNRWEGALLLGGYSATLAYWLRASL